MNDEWEKYIIAGDPLTKEHQEKLDKVKVDTAVANEKYLRDHPEIARLIEVFIRVLLVERPDDAVKFTAEFFCRDNLKDLVSGAWKDEDSDNE
jgi:hypothetical protein